MLENHFVENKLSSSLDDEIILGDDDFDNDNSDDDLLEIDYEDAWCANCGESKAHTLVKKQKQTLLVCTECNTEQTKELEQKRSEPKRRENKSPYKIEKLRNNEKYRIETWKKLIANRQPETALPYDIKACFDVDSLVSHKRFGLGIVCQKIEVTKVEILFEQGLKRLVCGKK